MRALLMSLVVFVALAGCHEAERPDYDPGLRAGDFVASIDNPWLPLKPGANWTYVAETEDGTERIEVVVLPDKKTIMGVAATVVQDTVRLEGVLVEDTFDWFAQDKWGNVWYLGEESKEYEDGESVGTEGSWEWGVDGALPGIIMWAEPVPNATAYYQEFYWGKAVDQGAVVDMGATVQTSIGTFTDTVTTREWNDLEPGVEELAHYARGIGVVLKEVSKGDEKGQKEELVAYFVP